MLHFTVRCNLLPSADFYVLFFFFLLCIIITIYQNIFIFYRNLGNLIRHSCDKIDFIKRAIWWDFHVNFPRP